LGIIGGAPLSVTFGTMLRFLAIFAGVIFVFGRATSRKPLSLAEIGSPKSGRILVFVGGNTMCEGWLWVSESATLKTVEDMVTFCPERVSRRVSITSSVENRKAKMDYRIDKMTDGEKDSVKLRHGDVIHFAFDRCFGLVPNGRPGAHAGCRLFLHLNALGQAQLRPGASLCL